jgi:hypothetical protein
MMRTASLPMYSLPEMEAANSAFWAALKRRLDAKGVDTAGIKLDSDKGPVPPGIGPEIFFTQICGYPLFKHYRDQALLVATPHYATDLPIVLSSWCEPVIPPNGLKICAGGHSAATACYLTPE